MICASKPHGLFDLTLWFILRLLLNVLAQLYSIIALNIILLDWYILIIQTKWNWLLLTLYIRIVVIILKYSISMTVYI